MKIPFGTNCNTHIFPCLSNCHFCRGRFNHDQKISVTNYAPVHFPNQSMEFLAAPFLGWVQKSIPPCTRLPRKTSFSLTDGVVLRKIGNHLDMTTSPLCPRETPKSCAFFFQDFLPKQTSSRGNIDFLLLAVSSCLKASKRRGASNNALVRRFWPGSKTSAKRLSRIL